MMSHLSVMPSLAIGLPLGIAAGWSYFSTLQWSVHLLTHGTPGRAVGLQAVRLGVLAVILFGLAKLGPWVLLAGAGGLLMARFAVLRRVRRSA